SITPTSCNVRRYSSTGRVLSTGGGRAGGGRRTTGLTTAARGAHNRVRHGRPGDSAWCGGGEDAMTTQATAAVLYQVKQPLVVEDVEWLEPGTPEVHASCVAPVAW